MDLCEFEASLDIVERQLELGMVKTITTENILNFVELLFSSNVKAQFYYNEKENIIQFCVKDCDLGVKGFDCLLDKKTVRNLIIYLKNLYNQLENIDT